MITSLIEGAARDTGMLPSDGEERSKVKAMPVNVKPPRIRPRGMRAQLPPSVWERLLMGDEYWENPEEALRKLRARRGK
jgi:hypothetical protein